MFLTVKVVFLFQSARFSFWQFSLQLFVILEEERVLFVVRSKRRVVDVLHDEPVAVVKVFGSVAGLYGHGGRNGRLSGRTGREVAAVSHVQYAAQMQQRAVILLRVSQQRYQPCQKINVMFQANLWNVLDLFCLFPLNNTCRSIYESIFCFLRMLQNSQKFAAKQSKNARASFKFHSFLNLNVFRQLYLL